MARVEVRVIREGVIGTYEMPSVPRVGEKMVVREAGQDLLAVLAVLTILDDEPWYSVTVARVADSR